MKSPGLNCLVGAMIVIASPACFAGPPVVTRSVDDMNADLMRTYQSPGGPSAGEIRSRSPDAAQADLVRDWNAKPATDPSVPIGSRNKTDAQNDLLRNWNAKPGTDD